MNYLYDGSFEGFLTCVWHHYYTEKADRIISVASAEYRVPSSFSGAVPKESSVQQAFDSSTSGSSIGNTVSDSVSGDINSDAAIGGWQPDFICAERTVETDLEKADLVSRAIERKISSYDLERIYRVFHTDTADAEMKLLRYIVLGFKRGAQIRLLHGEPVVFEVQKEEQRIGTEVHRLCGLIRFSVVQRPETAITESAFARTPDATASDNSTSKPLSASDNSTSKSLSAGRPDLLYAKIEPDNDVLEFLAPHFCARFRNDPFIIHDTKRKKALAAYHGEWQIATFEEGASAQLSNTEDEESYRSLWRQYFDTIAIKERTNPKCQKNFMPVRYWKNLTETQR